MGAKTAEKGFVFNRAGRDIMQEIPLKGDFVFRIHGEKQLNRLRAETPRTEWEEKISKT